MEGDFLMTDHEQNEATDDGTAMMILLERMVREQGQLATAERLGVNRKTVAGALETRHLSRRMTHALELLLLTEGNPILQPYEDRMTSMGERLDAVEGVVRGLAEGIETLRTSLDTHRAEQDRVNRILERRLSGESGVETRPASGDGRKPVKKAAKRRRIGTPLAIEAPARPTRPTFPRRDYDEIVTVEAANDDSYVYGRAWPLVREWRMLRRGHPVDGRTLSWMEKQRRLLTVELALLNEHGLTLPPDDHPIDDQWRRHVTGWRLRDLRAVRRRILRRKLVRWFRRVATFGAWWG